MSVNRLLLNTYVRPLMDYYRDRLPYAAPAEVAADLRGGLMDAIRGCAAACRIGTLGPALWYEVTTLCYQLMVRGNPEGVPHVAEIYAAQLPEILASSLPVGDKMCIYEMLKHLYGVSATDYAALFGFDRAVMRPYVEWLNGLDSMRETTAPRPPRAASDRLRVGYLCNFPAAMAPGRPAAPLFLSMILDHREHFDHELFVYSPGTAQPAWTSLLESFGIAPRTLGFTGYAARGDVGLPACVAALRRDHLDVILTDDNLGVPTYLYEHRVAPVQIYVPMGMPFWSIRNLEYILIGPIAPEESGAHLPPDRLVRGRFCLHPRLLDGPVDPAATAALRTRIPPDHRIAGVFSRFVKLSPDYLHAAGRMLADNPKLSLVIGGSGDASPIRRFIAESPDADRIVFFDHDVDIFTYGRLIDFFVDTFPFPGGNSAREVQYFGKPVLSLYTDSYSEHFRLSRDPILVARDVDAYVRLAGRLARDDDYLAERCVVAHEIGSADARAGGNVDLIRDVIGRATDDLAALRADA